MHVLPNAVSPNTKKKRVDERAGLGSPAGLGSSAGLGTPAWLGSPVGLGYVSNFFFRIGRTIGRTWIRRNGIGRKVVGKLRLGETR